MLGNVQEEFLEFKKSKGKISVDTTTFSIRELRDKHEKGEVVIEKYQREYLYSSNKYEKASKVIETILFNKILPPIVITKKDLKNSSSDGQNLEIIDGQQRVISIIKFISNEFCLNFDKDDSGYLLNGLYFKDLNPTLKMTILTYRITVMQLIVENQNIIPEIFIDLNYQPIPVTESELELAIQYGEISKTAKTYSKIGDSGKLVMFRQFWDIFGHQTKYKKDGSFNFQEKDRSGSIALEVLKTMLSFIDKKVVLNKNTAWVRDKLLNSKNKSLSDFKLDQFATITSSLKEIFKDEVMHPNKNVSPMFYTEPNKARATFLEPLADIVYLSLIDIDTIKLGEKQIDFEKEFALLKENVILNKDNEEQLNYLLKNFKITIQTLTK
jgi:hypothetical protein